MGIEKYLFYKNLSKHILLLNVKGLVTQSSLTLCDPVDWSPPGSSVHGILQAGILGWVAIPFSGGSSQPRSLTLKADSLPSEPSGKPTTFGAQGNNCHCLHFFPFYLP